jgi:hypothetical protein
MLERIERGEADGIIAWHPDRLARNSIDGGRIIYFLDRGLLKDLKFSTFTFENNSQGKFMLSILFGYSKYYVDNLSENVKRGNRAKLLRGWRPNHAPIGYLNDRGAKSIIKDPERFDLVLELFRKAVTGHYSLRALRAYAMNIGLKTPQGKRVGGRYLSISMVHRLLTNRFYAGVIEWGGTTYPGAHTPMVTMDELERVRNHLARSRKAAPKKLEFPFTGLIRCGECGSMVTAELKVNRHGKQYTYYHCTWYRASCQQRRYMPSRDLEAAIVEFICSLEVPPPIAAWASEQIRALQHDSENEGKRANGVLQNTLQDTVRSLNTLVGLRVREVISDEEFWEQRRGLQLEKMRIEQLLAEATTQDAWIRPVEQILEFAQNAPSLFRNSTDRVKKLIFSTLGSNSSLRDGKLSVEARKPFITYSFCNDRPALRGALNVFRTLYIKHDEELLTTLAKIREINELVERDKLLKKAA